MRDTSPRVPHGEGGVVVDVKVFTRENGDELAPGVNRLVRFMLPRNGKSLSEIRWQAAMEIRV